MKKIFFVSLLLGRSCSAMEAIDVFFNDLLTQNPKLEISHTNKIVGEKRCYNKSGYVEICEAFKNPEELKVLPDSICQLTKLTYLSLRGTALMTLPTDFGNLTGLETLCLSYNQLVSLPESFCQLTNLSKLYLDSNLLETLPLNFGDLTKLEYLDIRGNPWRSDEVLVYPPNYEFSLEVITFIGGIQLSDINGLSQPQIDTLLQNCRERKIMLSMINL